MTHQLKKRILKLEKTKANNEALQVYIVEEDNERMVINGDGFLLFDGSLKEGQLYLKQITSGSVIIDDIPG